MTGPLLIVDDEAPNLAVMRQILSQDYRLVFARNGSEALAAVHKHQPALILLDVQMPDMSGYAVCRTLKADPHTEGIPVIFVTSMSDVGNEAEGFASGAVDYIVKPVYPAIVLARVHAQLSLVRATRLEQSYRDAISMLGEAAHFNDTDTGVHIWRMAAYAAALARASGWNAEDCQLIELASPMHDTGKLGVPQSILQKPGPLSPQEWTVMKTHPQVGHDILARSDSPVFHMAAQIALQHHEKWDGGGYPRGLQGLAISEAARIVAIADVFDALSMRRPYKEPWPMEQVVANIQSGRGSHFDPRLTDVFLSILPEIAAIKAHWALKE
ncbi:MAG: response regulator [Rhodoferax sp.]|nr:response regulator [Rhodoferax sp.]